MTTCNRFQRAALPVALALLLGGCGSDDSSGSTPPPAVVTPSVTLTELAQGVVDTDSEQWQSDDFEHSGRIDAVSDGLAQIAELSDIDDERLLPLLQYLTYAPQAERSEPSTKALSQALLAITAMDNFHGPDAPAGSVQEAYLDALKSYLTTTTMSQDFSLHAAVLEKMLNQFVELDQLYTNERYDYVVYRLLQTLNQVGHDAYFDAQLREALLADADLHQAMLTFGSHSNAIIEGDTWPAWWVIDTLRKQYWLHYQGSAGIEETNADAQAQLDADMSAVVTAHQGSDFEQATAKIVREYLANTGGRGQLCFTTFTDVCFNPTSNAEVPQMPLLPEAAYGSDSDFVVGTLEVLESDSSQWGSLNQNGRMQGVFDAIHYLAQQDDIGDPRLDKLLYYITFTERYNALSEAELLSAHHALLAVAQMSDFLSRFAPAGTIQEGYSNALYHYTWELGKRGMLPPHNLVLSALFDHFTQLQDPYAYANYGYSIYSVMRSYTESSNDGWWSATLREDVLQDSALQQTMLSFAASNAAVEGGEPWPVWHGLNVLRKQYWLYNGGADGIDDTDTEAQASLDQSAVEIVQAHLDHSYSEVVKGYFYEYLQNSGGRGDALCTSEFAEVCALPPTVEDILPIQHACSDSVVIRAQQLTDDELASACGELAEEETRFHTMMETDEEPVADDYNDALRVVVFDSYDDYDQWGGVLFNINTDNGGIYIEGDPSDMDNQASFYAHEATWTDDILIWNLSHEYVHYLDGRFIKYGGFRSGEGFVFWAEGLAEYISLLNNNPDAVALASGDTLTLSQLFATTYDSGSTQVYRWGYLGIRFLYEQDKPALLSLAADLRVGDWAAYQVQLAALADSHEQKWQQWLSNLAPAAINGKVHSTVSAPSKPQRGKRPAIQ
ncbi:collagenase [Ferrimonas aestuarii]|uniref:Microbial collagenase n=1 Tax=Ferrimonas aestuarii TaxID=2569539 RepID=A0A4U1BNB7_9GAMM|nr:collagenase [Ferrimonas aestuarii]TKB53242.1 hypothetical protein FCL42_14305 [Ferrimonas aestuarii]